MLISELMGPEFTSEMAVTRKLLARIPDDKLAWQPAGDLHTVGWNATHLAEIAGWVPAILNQRELDVAPVDGPAYSTPEPTTTRAVLDRFDANVAKSAAALAGVPDAAMAEPWSLVAGGHEIFTMAKGDCLRKWVFGHAAHHRGILSAYLRMAGVPHASIYEE